MAKSEDEVQEQPARRVKKEEKVEKKPDRYVPPGNKAVTLTDGTGPVEIKPAAFADDLIKRGTHVEVSNYGTSTA